MSKELRIRICSFMLAAVLSFFGTAYSVTLIASASSPTSWADVGEDAIALKDAYLEYFGKIGDGDIIGAVVTGAVDIPISWLKLRVDGDLAISPVDDLYYYLKDGVLQFEDNREHRSGGGGGRRRGEASEIKPDVPADFVKQVKDYWSEYYKPHSNSHQFVWSLQDHLDSVYNTTSWWFNPPAPIYCDGDSWGGKGWSEVYFLYYLKIDGITYYSPYYSHFSGGREDGNALFYSELLSLLDSSVKNSRSCSWNGAKYIGYGAFQSVWFFSDLSYYLSGNRNISIGQYVSDSGSSIVYGNLSNLKYYSTSNLIQSSSFTPNTDSNDDQGFIISSEPFELYANQDQIDYGKIPDSYTITINGDNIYNYPITDPTNGKSTTINNYITNNYYFGDDDDSGGDTTNNFWNIDFPDFIANITTSIEAAITNVFVADVDVINNYNSELQDTFDKKLPFVYDFGDIFKSLFVEIVDNNFVYAGDIKPSYSSPDTDSGGTSEASGSDSGGVRNENIIYPKWSIDLTFFGKDMELTILDFSMYAEPLSYVRLVACVFIYAVYFVNLMKYLPTLIGNVMDMGNGVYSAVTPKKGKGDE